MKYQTRLKYKGAWFESLLWWFITTTQWHLQYKIWHDRTHYPCAKWPQTNVTNDGLQTWNLVHDRTFSGGQDFVGLLVFPAFLENHRLVHMQLGQLVPARSNYPKKRFNPNSESFTNWMKITTIFQLSICQTNAICELLPQLTFQMVSYSKLMVPLHNIFAYKITGWKMVTARLP